MSRLVLGLNTHHGDASAVLLGPSGPIAAIAQERIDRVKHSANFPADAVREVLRIAGADIADVTDIAVARDPNANLPQKLAYVVSHGASGLEMARRRLMVHRKVRSTAEELAEAMGIDVGRIRADFHQVEHHLAHVASAFYWSPFERAAGFTCDGAGDFASQMFARCEDLDIEVLGRTYWPHSLGVFYSALTQFLGFDRYGEEYKVMGLSAYGEDRYGRVLRDMVHYEPGRGIRLNLKYFVHHEIREAFETIEGGQVRLPRLYGPQLERALGPARIRGAELTEREKDIAMSMQRRHEEVFLDAIADLIARTGLRDLVLAGGSVLNSVANGRMITEGYAERAYFQPAASDDGTAAGAASYVLHAIHRVPRHDPVTHAYLGTEWSDAEIEKAVVASGRPVRRLERMELLQTAAKAMAAGKVLGWFQGREEWGPRALGNRSILCNPAYPDMKAILNARIKNREAFRPFAPAVRIEDLPEVFEGTHEVPFMIVVYKVRPEWRERVPAITHADGTGRVQTVRREDNPLYYDLIGVFRETTGIPVVLNTSFNENEPIVHTPAQAIACFERTKMDCLAIGSFWLEKSDG